jgi:LysM repeat protein
MFAADGAARHSPVAVGTRLGTSGLARPRRTPPSFAMAQDAPTRSRRTLIRVALALTSTTTVLAVAAITAAAAVVPPIGARRMAREAARRELALQLAGDERVVASVFASQRRWTDMFRESFGVLAATDRRLVYVVAPPSPLLRPREDGPGELLVESYPYDAAFTLEPRPLPRALPLSLLRHHAEALTLRSPVRREDFLVDPASWPSALAVSSASALARERVARERERLAAADQAPPPLPDVYVPYTVRRGDNLTLLARRFGTTPDVLRQLNLLRTDQLQAGQRLRVPQVVAVDSAGPDEAPGDAAPTGRAPARTPAAPRSTRPTR